MVANRILVPWTNTALANCSAKTYSRRWREAMTGINKFQRHRKFFDAATSIFLNPERLISLCSCCHFPEWGGMALDFYLDHIFH